MSLLRSTSFPALGTTATLVTAGGAHDEALAILEEELDAIDRACSRFRADSELSRLNRAGGRPLVVSELFVEATEAALRAARITDGAVDPTVGRALRAVGYDRDFAAIDPAGPPLTLRLSRVVGWAAVRVDPTGRTVAVPRGVELDFGATAKALCADRVARRASRATGQGILVSLGGDIAAAGEAPGGGWPVGISDDHRSGGDGCTVAMTSGGLATSSTTVRRWRRGDQELHHLIDPRTGAPVRVHWRTVSVAAASCVDANIASCASVVMGEGAVAWLEDRRLPARLVDRSGDVVTINGWAREPRPVGAGGPS